MACHCETDLNALAAHQTSAWEPSRRTTERGFGRIEFRDRYGQECSAQESSLATERAIWLGVGGCRMHLTQGQALGLANLLLAFVTDGSLVRTAGGEGAPSSPSRPLADYPTATEDTVCERCGERGHWWCYPSRLRFTGRGQPRIHLDDLADGEGAGS